MPKSIGLGLGPEFQGMMGLGFGTPQVSPITLAIALADNSTNLQPTFIKSIFAQNKTTPNVVSILLSRTDDLEATANSSFTIGEYLAGYEQVQTQPHLPLFIPENGLARWSVIMEGYSVNGKLGPLHSASPNVTNGTAIAVIDTGATLVQVPAEVSSTIYSPISDAFFSETLGQWVVPCTAEPSNVTFHFG